MCAPNMSNSFLNQPHTILSANRPFVTSSIVADIFATISGCTKRHVAGSEHRDVVGRAHPEPKPRRSFSNVVLLKFDGPP